MSAGLEINFEGDVRVPTQDLSFGRSADLVLDEANQFLHRVCGVLTRASGVWMIHNVGSALAINAVTGDGAEAVIPSGAHFPIAGPDGVFRIAAGGCNYEIGYLLESSATHSVAGSASGAQTTSLRDQFTAGELKYLGAFADPVMRPGRRALPSYAQVASQFDVSARTVENMIRSARVKAEGIGISNIDTVEKLVLALLDRGALSAKDASS